MTRGANLRRYTSLREWLVTNISTCDCKGCWLGQEKCCSDYGYCRVSLRIPSVGHRKLTAHILLWVIDQTDAQTAEEAWWYYWEFRCSGLELDHTCNEVTCRRPDHLDPVTRQEQEQRKHERRRQAAADQ